METHAVNVPLSAGLRKSDLGPRGRMSALRAAPDLSNFSAVTLPLCPSPGSDYLN
jgi:hypothetical protein